MAAIIVCVSEILLYPVAHMFFSRFCGTAQGYGQLRPDGFLGYLNLNQIYTDGISLTYKHPNRSHIWTFSTRATKSHRTGSCDVNNNKPEFVSINYYCMTLIDDKHRCPSLPARASEQGNVIGSVSVSESTIVLSM